MLGISNGYKSDKTQRQAAVKNQNRLMTIEMHRMTDQKYVLQKKLLEDIAEKIHRKSTKELHTL